MELKQLRQKSADELKAHLVELHKESFALRMQKATGQLAKTHEPRRVEARDRSREHAAGREEVRTRHDRQQYRQGAAHG